MKHQQAAVGPLVVEPPQGELDLPVGDRQPQVIAGDGFQRVGFVENHHVVLGQQVHALPPQGEVGEKQGMVDHQDLARLARRRA